MARLENPGREKLDAEGQAVYDGIVASRGGARGPFGPLLHNPPVAKYVTDLGAQLRFSSSLPGPERELAILTAGREVEALYEWHAHEAIGLREGTRPEAIAVVRDRKPTDGLPAREALLIDAVRAMYREHRLSDDLYGRLLAEFGEKTVVELVVLAGYYGMIGFVLNTFEVGLPEGATPGFTRS